MNIFSISQASKYKYETKAKEKDTQNTPIVEYQNNTARRNIKQIVKNTLHNV